MTSLEDMTFFQNLGEILQAHAETSSDDPLGLQGSNNGHFQQLAEEMILPDYQIRDLANTLTSIISDAAYPNNLSSSEQFPPAPGQAQSQSRPSARAHSQSIDQSESGLSQLTARTSEESHCVIINRIRSSSNKYRCNYCSLEFTGGPQKIRVHLAGQTINKTRISPCKNVPSEVKELMLKRVTGGYESEGLYSDSDPECTGLPPRNAEESHCIILSRCGNKQAKSSNSRYKCIYCRLRFVGGPQKIRVHLTGQVEGGTRVVKCKKVPKDVLKEMQNRRNNSQEEVNKAKKSSSSSSKKASADKSRHNLLYPMSSQMQASQEAIYNHTRQQRLNGIVSQPGMEMVIGQGSNNYSSAVHPPNYATTSGNSGQISYHMNPMIPAHYVSSISLNPAHQHNGHIVPGAPSLSSHNMTGHAPPVGSTQQPHYSPHTMGAYYLQAMYHAEPMEDNMSSMLVSMMTSSIPVPNNNSNAQQIHIRNDPNIVYEDGNLTIGPV